MQSYFSSSEPIHPIYSLAEAEQLKPLVKEAFKDEGPFQVGLESLGLPPCLGTALECDLKGRGSLIRTEMTVGAVMQVWNI